MKRARKLFDGVHHARRRAVDGVADDDDVSPAQRTQVSPARPRAQRIDVMLRVPGMRARKHNNLRLEPYDFFEADARPFGRRVHHGLRSGASQRVGDERVAADRDQRIGPDHEEHAARHSAGQAPVEIGKPRTKVFHQRHGRFFGMQYTAEALHRRNHFVDRVRIGDVHGQAQARQRFHGFTAIDGLSSQGPGRA